MPANNCWSLAVLAESPSRLNSVCLTAPPRMFVTLTKTFDDAGVTLTDDKRFNTNGTKNFKKKI